MDRLQRKTVLVTIYYYQNEPIVSLDSYYEAKDDFDSPDCYFLNNAIHDVMVKYNPTTEIFDVAIDETKPWIFSSENRFARYFFRLLRRR